MSAGPTPVLPKEVALRIQRNRKIAQERLQRHREQLAAVEEASRGGVGGADVSVVSVPATGPSAALTDPGSPHATDLPHEEPPFFWSCPNTLEGGAVCGGSHDRKIKEHFGEIVCYRCKGTSTDYDYITKEAAKREYLLSDAAIKPLRFILKPNQMNPRWADIKLYLRKHCITVALLKWGDMDSLQAELRRKEVAKYDESVERTKALFESSSSAEDGSAKRNSSSKQKGRKRKQSELESMVSIIRGE